ncbi:unnamed protein product [Caenorhabditis angaria]|uniref:Methyltransferase domain-containing protein n=1 Tax=Caenorhabditis angaria TaxID=860376 RepID=A0A9P1MS16_9PELO|nr:unnamed protein product [Caenorhabditis angaria]
MFSRVFIRPSSSHAAYQSIKSNDVTQITAVDVISQKRITLEIEERKSDTKKRFRREFNLPPKALDGLRSAILNCSRSAKQLQNEADQLTQQLEQRKFPQSPLALKKVRDEIKQKIKMSKKAGDEEILDDDSSQAQAQRHNMRNEVDKVLKKFSFNWKPLDIQSKEAAASYWLSRFAPNYAEISRCLEELNRDSDFVPQSVLDFGCGSASAYWAVTSKWPDAKIHDFTMVDSSDSMTRFAIDTIMNHNNPEDVSFTQKNILFRRSLTTSKSTNYDLVIAHRVLCEIGSSESRLEIIEQLWKKTNKYLILVESSQSAAFAAILEAREFLLKAGNCVDFERLLGELQEKNELSQDVIEIVRNSSMSDYEKYELLAEKLCPNIVETIPTLLPKATVFAPCPHDLKCPLGIMTPCTFMTRFQTIRADGKRSEREKDGTEQSKFTFIIFEKSPRRLDQTSPDRILKNRKLGGHATCDVCTKFNGLQRLTLSKKHGKLYSALKSMKDGDILPLDARKSDVSL